MSDWNGEGLPPVGTVCEYKDCQRGWVRTRILAHHPDGSCAWHGSVEPDAFVCDTSYSTDSGSAFRPIRTAEEVAVEAMTRELCGDDMGDDASRDCSIAIYAAIRDGKIPGVKLESTS